jgi:hypothetical protein
LTREWLASAWRWRKNPVDNKIIAQDIMAMVQFQRAVEPTLTTVDAGQYESDWTKPEWVIFNADARFWRFQQSDGSESAVDTKFLRLKPDGSVIRVDVNEADEVVSTLAPRLPPGERSSSCKRHWGSQLDDAPSLRGFNARDIRCGWRNDRNL